MLWISLGAWRSKSGINPGAWRSKGGISPGLDTAEMAATATAKKYYMGSLGSGSK